MPGGMKGKKGRGKKASRGGSLAVDRVVAHSTEGTGANTTFIETDFSYRRQNMNMVQVPPKSIGNQIFWTKCSLNNNFSTSSSSNTENNLQFSLNSLPGYTNWTGSFDQYCIYAVSCSFTSISGAAGTLWTAIDYDNVANIGLNAILQYNTFNAAQLSSNDSVVRYVKPCLDPITYASNYGSGRLWLDSGSPGAVHYGLRVIAGVFFLNNSAVASGVQYNLTYVLGFRNSI
jgi:hypothetical protein